MSKDQARLKEEVHDEQIQQNERHKPYTAYMQYEAYAY